MFILEQQAIPCLLHVTKFLFQSAEQMATQAAATGLTAEETLRLKILAANDVSKPTTPIALVLLAKYFVYPCMVKILSKQLATKTLQKRRQRPIRYSSTLGLPRG